ncbi:MAG TPA: hypothetical protein VIK75_09810 [Calditerricola sp.]
MDATPHGIPSIPSPVGILCLFAGTLGLNNGETYRAEKTKVRMAMTSGVQEAHRGRTYDGRGSVSSAQAGRGFPYGHGLAHRAAGATRASFALRVGGSWPDVGPAVAVDGAVCRVSKEGA